MKNSAISNYVSFRHKSSLVSDKIDYPKNSISKDKDIFKKLSSNRDKLVLFKDNEQKKVISLPNNTIDKLKQYFPIDNFIEDSNAIELSGLASGYLSQIYKELNKNIDKKLKEFSDYKKRVDENQIEHKAVDKTIKDNSEIESILKNKKLKDIISTYQKNSKIKHSYQYKNAHDNTQINDLSKLKSINSNILSMISNPVNNILTIQRLSNNNGNINSLDKKEQEIIKNSKISIDKNSYKSKYGIYLPTSLAKDNQRLKNDMLIASTIKQNIKNMLQFTTGIYNYQIPIFFDFTA